MKYRIKTWEQMLAMEGARLDIDGYIDCESESSSFAKSMRHLCGASKEQAEDSGWRIYDWMLEEIPEEPDIYETHKANLYAHGVKLPAMMEVRSRRGKWVKKVIFALENSGYAISRDGSYKNCRPIQKVNVEELKNSAYLGLK